MVTHPSLYKAAESGSIQLVLKWIKERHDINCRIQGLNSTPILTAVYEGHLDVMYLLVEHNCDVNAKDSTGRSSLSWLALRGQNQAIVHLLQNGADIHTRDDQGETPLLAAVRAGRRETVAILLDNGANIDDRDNDGNTALMCAATQAQVHVFDLLLYRGARLDLRDIYGRTTLDKLDESMDPYTVKQLIDMRIIFKTIPLRQKNNGLFWGDEMINRCPISGSMKKSAGMIQSGYPICGTNLKSNDMIQGTCGEKETADKHHNIYETGKKCNTERRENKTPVYADTCQQLSNDLCNTNLEVGDSKYIQDRGLEEIKTYMGNIELGLETIRKQMSTIGATLSHQIFQTGRVLYDHVCETEKGLSGQILQTEKGLADQIHQTEEGLAGQIQQTERAMATAVMLDAGDASNMPVECKHPVLKRNQHIIEENLEATDDTLKKLFAHGVITIDEWSKIKAQKTNRGRTKLLLMIIDGKNSTEIVGFFAAGLGETICGNNNLLADLLVNDINDF